VGCVEEVVAGGPPSEINGNRTPNGAIWMAIQTTPLNQPASESFALAHALIACAYVGTRLVPGLTYSEIDKDYR
jgi:hypothetical protein